MTYNLEILTGSSLVRTERCATTYRLARMALVAAIASGWCGCNHYLAVQDMHVQPAYHTYDQSDFFGDEQSAHPWFLARWPEDICI